MTVNTFERGKGGMLIVFRVAAAFTVTLHPAKIKEEDARKGVPARLRSPRLRTSSRE